MGDVIDWAASEPPNRYVLAFGTSHCLVEQDYDHSVYGECAYIGSRTLIKCKAVRKKTDLKANGGICEMHKLFHDSIKNRFCCEDRRMMQDTGQGKPKYSPFLNHDGLICEEYYWLMPSHRWESPLSRSTFDYAPDDDMLAPLWNAGVYTDKDLLRLRKILSEKRVEYLKLHAEMIMERVRRKASDLFSKNGKLLTLGDATAAITAACSSIDEYGVITKRLIASRRCELERSDKSGRLQAQPLLCSFGKLQRNLAADNDRITVLSVLHSILDCIACNKEDFISYREIQDSKGLAKVTLEVGSEKNLQCSAPAVPLTMFCISHQMLDERQLLFVPCSMCHSMCADIRSPPLCEDSRVKRVPMKDVRISASPAANFSTSSPISSISSKSKTFNDPSKPLFGLPSNSGSAPFISPSLSDRRGNKRISVDIQSKEEADELSKRFKTEAPPQLPLAESVSQGQTPAVIDAIRRAEMRRHKEEMCSCSRIRPFERSQFPPKSSLPRRINTANRLPLPVRRPFLVEGSSSQSQRPSYAAQIRRHAGSDTLPYRQLSGMSSRRSQPPHRVLLKDGSISSQYSVSLGQKPIGSTGLGLQSSSTFTAIDESGNEVLVEDRRTPPTFQSIQGNIITNDVTRRRPPVQSQMRSLISSYRRQPASALLRHPVVVGQHIREKSSNGDATRAHLTLPPPPDPPILPLSSQSGGPLFRSIRSSVNTNASTNEERVGGTLSNTASLFPSSTSEQTKVTRDEQDFGARVLPPPPAPPSLRPRFPTILRKNDPSICHTNATVPSSSDLGQQSAVKPRPPLSSRPLPPHRLINAAVRAVPPHRLIKSLPLPVVPAPRLPKSSINTDSVSPAGTSCDVPCVDEQVDLPPESQVDDKESISEKSGALTSEDTEALRILAAVSEAAAAAVPPSQSLDHSTKTGASNGDDDDEFEEEL